MPELKVKKGIAKSSASIRSSRNATTLFRLMNTLAFSRNPALGEGSEVLCEKMMFCVDMSFVMV